MQSRLVLGLAIFGTQLCLFRGVQCKDSVSIRELHEKTGEVVRRAGASRVPVPVTDRGEVVAVLVGPDAVPLKKRAKRVLLPEYVKLILEGPLSNDVLEDLDAVRGER